MVRRHNINKKRMLTIMQANVGRGCASHNLALHLAHEIKAEILLIQEPWIYSDLTTKQSVTHPSYDTFSSPSKWITCPRVLTYVKKAQDLRPFQKSTEISPDLLKITITGSNHQKLLIWNVYNASPNCINPGAGLQAIFSSSQRPFSSEETSI